MADARARVIGKLCAHVPDASNSCAPTPIRLRRVREWCNNREPRQPNYSARQGCARCHGPMDIGHAHFRGVRVRSICIESVDKPETVRRQHNFDFNRFGCAWVHAHPHPVRNSTAATEDNTPCRRLTRPSWRCGFQRDLFKTQLRRGNGATDRERSAHYLPAIVCARGVFKCVRASDGDNDGRLPCVRAAVIDMVVVVGVASRR